MRQYDTAGQVVWWWSTHSDSRHDDPNNDHGTYVVVVERCCSINRASDFQPTESVFESWAAVVGSVTPRCSSSPSCVNDYMAIYHGARVLRLLYVVPVYSAL